ncbi:conserved hypothetical protein [Ricinus communis]|uniref:Uncharacterized protein n=1 Tax=Ricinus communis TaxID=3988 RepID=B9SDI8_RICCO|nr:conserved hypothetical protein [Ricinus communis]
MAKNILAGKHRTTSNLEPRTSRMRLFFKANQADCREIKDVLAGYEKASGQGTNKQKSSLYFSSNVGEVIRSYIRFGLGIIRDGGHEMYIGLPSLIGRNKRQVCLFSFIKDKDWHRFLGWRKKYLSRVGKEIPLETMTFVLN